jgi:type II secretion system protein G
MGKRRGFTLIELLIVVAIIAILAAIAVPNFLEAHTRAKIARVKSDMRSFGVALEAYSVDNMHYPLSEWHYRGLTGVKPPQPMNMFLLHVLTTPVAHITSLPRDIFMSVSGHMQNNKFKLWKDTYWYETVKGFMPGVGLNDRYVDGAQVAGSRGFAWMLRSLGPHRSLDAPGSIRIIPFVGGTNPGYAYDPTNGTMSSGWIIYSNAGFVDGSVANR